MIDVLLKFTYSTNNSYTSSCDSSFESWSSLYNTCHWRLSGLQSGTLKGAAPYATPLSLKFLPQYLNELGYRSEAVGKWHLGSHRAGYTPTKRGFRSHVGFWTGHIDYYDHTAEEFYPPVVRFFS